MPRAGFYFNAEHPKRPTKCVYTDGKNYISFFAPTPSADWQLALDTNDSRTSGFLTQVKQNASGVFGPIQSGGAYSQWIPIKPALGQNLQPVLPGNTSDNDATRGLPSGFIFLTRGQSKRIHIDQGGNIHYEYTSDNGQSWEESSSPNSQNQYFNSYVQLLYKFCCEICRQQKLRQNGYQHQQQTYPSQQGLQNSAQPSSNNVQMQAYHTQNGHPGPAPQIHQAPTPTDSQRNASQPTLFDTITGRLNIINAIHHSMVQLRKGYENTALSCQISPSNNGLSQYKLTVTNILNNDNMALIHPEQYGANVSPKEKQKYTEDYNNRAADILRARYRELSGSWYRACCIFGFFTTNSLQDIFNKIEKRHLNRVTKKSGNGASSMLYYELAVGTNDRGSDDKAHHDVMNSPELGLLLRN